MNIKPRTTLILLLVLQLVITYILKYYNYIGDNSPELLQYILQFFTAEQFERGVAYGQRGLWISVLAPLFQTAVTIAFVFTPLSKRIETKLSSICKGNYLLTLIGFVLIYKLIRWILFLPLNYYGGFVLEHEFGFSNMSVSVWFVRSLKYLLVDIVPLTFSVSAAFLIIKKFRKTWVPIILTVSIVTSIVMVLLYPVVVTPLFYKVSTLEDGELSDNVYALARESDITIDAIHTINSGAYSNHSNAYFTGLGEKKQIVLYDKLIETHSTEEILSVLAHEIGHWKHDHVLKGLFYSWIGIALLLIGLYYLYPYFKSDKKLDLKDLTAPSTVPFILFIVTLANFFSSPIQSGISRAFEREADRMSLELFDNSDIFIETQVNLSTQNRSRLNPHPLVVFWKYSHPPTVERIRVAEKK